jgi:hypothetical protein
MKPYEVRYEGKQVTATYTDAGFLINGVIVPTDKVETLNPYVTTAQVWEWYGDEEHVGESAFGRYKPKGAQEFIIHLTTAESYNEEEILAILNNRLNDKGRWTRFEFKGELKYYYPPTTIQL